MYLKRKKDKPEKKCFPPLFLNARLSDFALLLLSLNYMKRKWGQDWEGQKKVGFKTQLSRLHSWLLWQQMCLRVLPYLGACRKGFLYLLLSLSLCNLSKCLGLICQMDDLFSILRTYTSLEFIPTTQHRLTHFSLQKLLPSQDHMWGSTNPISEVREMTTERERHC